MSDDFDHVVGLDVPAADRDAVTDRVRAVLLSSGWVVDRQDDAGGYWFGPRVGGSAESFVGTARLSAAPDVVTAMAGDVGPRCPHCGERAPEEVLEAVYAWPVSGEPTVTCARCGRTQRVGDMDNTDGAVWGAPVLTLESDGEVEAWTMADEIAVELHEALGGRWARVHEHL